MVLRELKNTHEESRLCDGGFVSVQAKGLVMGDINLRTFLLFLAHSGSYDVCLGSHLIFLLVTVVSGLNAAFISLCYLGSSGVYWSCRVGDDHRGRHNLEFLPLPGGLVPTKQKSGKEIDSFCCLCDFGFSGPINPTWAFT